MSDSSLIREITLPTGKTLKVQTGLFINNEFVEAVDGKRFETINPATGKVITTVAEASEKDIDLAVEVATEAFENVWKNFDGQKRGELMNKLADLLERDSEELAVLEALDNGKAYLTAKFVDVKGIITTIRYFAGWADKIHGKVVETSHDKFTYTRHEPIGVVGQIIPWNFPLCLLAGKMAPALACGNTVIIKPAEQTPLSALKVATLIKEAGFPPGVVNIVPGFGKTAGAAIASHMKIWKVAFTGSTLVGRSILKAAAESNLKKVSLELGGKSPNIILEDADIEQAVKWAHMGIFFNNGQICCAGSRVYVQEKIYDKFLEQYKNYVLTKKLGDPFDAETYQGPQVSELQFDRIMNYIDVGKKEGATLLMGGERHGNEGYYIKPTIFTDVNENMKIMQEEIFGPVVAIAKFKTVEEALERAHITKYGLAAAVFTKDLTRAIKISNALKAGTVWVNCYNLVEANLPFGGYKESGIGRDGGKYALDQYTEVKTVVINLDAQFAQIGENTKSPCDLVHVLPGQPMTFIQSQFFSSIITRDMASNITWHEGVISRNKRETLLGQKGLTIWFTGLSASGKSTLASALEQYFLQLGITSYRLDGDNIRFGLNKDLGFGPKDRTENIRRIAECVCDKLEGKPIGYFCKVVARLFADATIITLASFISPYQEDREAARKLHEDNRIPFIEVFVDAPLEVVEKRDPKGLYKKAKAGEIKEFTGISAPYEIPPNPEIHIHTDETTIEEGVKTIINYLIEKGYYVPK
ncbi:hypothetical protein G9A89_022350 [Geosiphon pyriformis]|nr:hypothetical protein G9A89_022350 [Geosiphon pyriformis]